MQAQIYLNDGYENVIELDVEKFFDKVNHDKLMGLLAKQKTDKRTLKLIRRVTSPAKLWKAGGKSTNRRQSAKSPAIQIVLNEVDKEFEARGHKGMSKLLFNSESQKQDASIRRTGTDKDADGNMETMETTLDKKDEPSKVWHQRSEGI